MTRRPRPWPARLGLLLRFAISFGLLALLASSIDLRTMLAVVAQAKLGWLAAGGVAIVVLYGLMAVRWYLILTAYGVDASFGEVFRHSFVSTSVGQVLPGGIGGDVVRIYQLSRRVGKVAEISQTVVVDRAFGLSIMFFAGMPAAAYLAFGHGQTMWLDWFTAINLVLLGGWLGLMVGRYRIRRHMTRLAARQDLLGRGASVLLALVVAVADLGVIRRVLLRLVVFSLLVHLGRCFLFFSAYRALGGDVDAVYFLIFVPVVFFLSFLPISLSGLGVREGTLVYFFAGLGVMPEVSVAAGLLTHLLQIVAAVPGILMLLMPGRAAVYPAPAARRDRGAS